MTRAFHRTGHLLSALALASTSATMPGAFAFLLPGAGKPAVAATAQHRTWVLWIVGVMVLVRLPVADEH